MAELTNEEIQAQLEKLGIHSRYELHYYSKEYKEYSAHIKPVDYPPYEDSNVTQLDQQDQFTLARKFALTCRTLFPVLGNFFTLSRVKVYKK